MPAPGEASQSVQYSILILTLTVPLQDDEGDTMSQMTTDEVDGSSSRRKNSTAVIVDTFFKLAFLKVLIVDIGISIGKMPPND